MNDWYKRALVMFFTLAIFSLGALSVYKAAGGKAMLEKNIKAVEVETAQNNIADMMNENLAITEKLIEYEKKTLEYEKQIGEMSSINSSVQNLLFSYEAFQHKDFINCAEYLKDVDFKVLTERQKNIYNNLVDILRGMGYIQT